jgi:hypothetical protein
MKFQRLAFHALKFPKGGKRAEKILDRIHSDLCGPMENESLGGNIMTFIDDASRKVFVYFLKQKSESLSAFKNFKSLVETQTESKIKRIRTDNGTEYVNKDFKKFLEESGIIHEKTVPYTPEQNGLAERMNRTIIEKARCLLFDANLEKKLCAEAVNTAVHIINRSPTKSNKISPEEIWTGKKPDVSHLRVFGTKVMVHIPKEMHKKWDKKSEEGIFVGYSDVTKGYRVYSSKKDDVIVRRDIIFVNEQKIQEDNQKSEAVDDMVYFELESYDSNATDTESSDEDDTIVFNEVGDLYLSLNIDESDESSDDNLKMEHVSLNLEEKSRKTKILILCIKQRLMESFQIL